MMKIFKVLLAIFLPLSAFSQQSFSLEEAINYAVQNSNDVKLKRLEISDAKSQVKEFMAIGIPQVTGNFDYQYFIDIPTSVVEPFFPEQDVTTVEDVNGQEIPVSFTRLDENDNPIFGDPQELQFGVSHNISYGAEASFLLFDGTFFVGLKAARMYKDLLIKEVNVTKTEVSANVAKAYLGVLVAERSKAMIDKNIVNLKKILDETAAVYENGFAEKLDVERLELSLANLETDAKNLERLILVSKNLLKFQMNYPLEQKVDLTDNLDALVGALDVSGEILSGPVNFNDRPEYAVLDAAEDLNEVNLQRYKVGYLPSIYGFGSYQRTFQTNNLSEGKWFPTTVVGASVNVPIFDGFDKEAKIQRTKIDLEEINVQREQFEDAMTLEVANARISFLNAQQTVSRRDATVELAQKIYDTAQIKYREGVGSSLEASQAESELYEAQTNYINALYDLLIAKADLDKALGNY